MVRFEMVGVETVRVKTVVNNPIQLNFQNTTNSFGKFTYEWIDLCYIMGQKMMSKLVAEDSELTPLGPR
ncbi:hypothetical protein HanRHA438_Chr14g0643721 [Helianthus annuus]|nr:hypothetical protein HanHA300_Chr14g0515901 [Helianthus annuus]KAJ0484924.1 hypothetical protein HanHA89_Chr14g0562341 [Helianthus annuus]KAJ0655474.1 hypothetical protein HanLR1_Chr14g0524661 [Helianthus annuus]KAJ0659166.1 hypothetical protein HanOQP8_Chr14g0522971 [Helianthus annuus]KAJ0852788.1 hypothetical protein HanRHA438_Chr14g0643721 [Helianthus annuus]